MKDSPRYIDIRVDKMHLEEHVEKICCSNLKRNTKICKSCVMPGPVKDIFHEKGTKYVRGVLPADMDYHYSRDGEVEYVDMKIPYRVLEDRVRNFCRGNIQRNIKICTKCPVLGPVIDIMNEKGWKVTPEFKEYGKFYYSMYPKK